MLYPVKPSFLIKSIWFTGGAATAYAAYYATFKDLWSGAKLVSKDSSATCVLNAAAPLRAARSNGAP